MKARTAWHGPVFSRNLLFRNTAHAYLLTTYARSVTACLVEQKMVNT